MGKRIKVSRNEPSGPLGSGEASPSPPSKSRNAFPPGPAAPPPESFVRRKKSAKRRGK